MKKKLLFVATLFINLITYSQSFNYQAIVRDASGNPVVDQSIGVQLKILDGGPAGATIYTESHTVTSSSNGVMSLAVGTGTTSDMFTTIDWSLQNQWLDVSVDVTGGTAYTNIGTSKLQHVPYALHASSANSLNGGVQSIADTDNDTKIQVEASPDEDIIRLDVAGTQVAQFGKNANGDMLLGSNSSSLIIGSGAGATNTGDSNVFLGRDAARINTTGRRNIVIGSQAGFSLTEGTLNVYIGTIAGRDNPTGSRNTSVGDSAGSGPSGTGNTYLGTASGATSGGNDNVFLGDSAGANNAAGNNNTMVGVGAGLSSTGTGNVLIGYFVGASETGDNKLHIDNTNTTTPLIYGEFDNDILQVNGALTTTGITNANGGIYLPNAFGPDAAYVGTAGNSISFGHSGSSEDFLGYTNNNFYFRDSPGGGDVTQPSVYAQGFPTYSSRRWKHNIKAINNATTIINKLQGVTYTWNKDQGGYNDFGFIAEDVNKILPEIAKKGADGQVDGIEYGKITPYLVEALKEQQKEIDELKSEIKSIKHLLSKQ